LPGVVLTWGSSQEQHVNRKELIAAVAGKAGVAEGDTDEVLAASRTSCSTW